MGMIGQGTNGGTGIGMEFALMRRVAGLLQVDAAANRKLVWAFTWTADLFRKGIRKSLEQSAREEKQS